jgi:hypothetical protein
LHVIRTGLADHDHFHLKAHIPPSSQSRHSIKLVRHSDKKVFFDRWPSTHRRRKCYDFPYSYGNHNVFYRSNCKSLQF